MNAISYEQKQMRMPMLEMPMIMTKKPDIGAISNEEKGTYGCHF